MSRVGKVPIKIPSGISVEETPKELVVKGPKGTLNVRRLPAAEVAVNGDEINVTAKAGAPSSAQQGLLRTLIQNAITGVSEGYQKRLEIQGVGYRAQLSGNKLTLELGFSHPVEYSLPQAVEATVENNIITISGSDKQLVGQVAANIRAFRKPEPYKGKGIRYEGEQVKRKAGKTAAAGPGAGA